jgi:phage terminase large subunit-like protein
MASNVMVSVGAYGLMKPDKVKSREKFDGISATLDALGRAMIVPLSDGSGIGCFSM